VKEPIHRDMPIVEIFDTFGTKSHKLVRAMSEAGIDCSCCCSHSDETLEQKLASRQMTDDQINAFMSRLNAVFDEPDDAPAIQMTEQAAKQFRAILAEEKKTGWALRFGIQASGCCGFEYFLDYSHEAQPTDDVFESHGVQIHVDKKSTPQLLGSTIDYAEDKHGAGFKVIGPTSGCGCHSHGCCS
jgi:iron-sulfur cluster assembly protein